MTFVMPTRSATFALNYKDTCNLITLLRAVPSHVTTGEWHGFLKRLEAHKVKIESQVQNRLTVVWHGFERVHQASRQLGEIHVNGRTYRDRLAIMRYDPETDAYPLQNPNKPAHSWRFRLQPLRYSAFFPTRKECLEALISEFNTHPSWSKYNLSGVREAVLKSWSYAP